MAAQLPLRDRLQCEHDTAAMEAALRDEARRLNLALLAGPRLPQAPEGFALRSVDLELYGSCLPGAFATRNEPPTALDLLPIWPNVLCAAGIPRHPLLAEPYAAPPGAVVLRTALALPDHAEDRTTAITRLRATLRTITNEALWVAALSLAADQSDPMNLIWALLEEIPDTFIGACAPLLARLTDLSLPVEPLARLLGQLDRRTPAAEIAAAAARIAPSSSSLTHRFAMRLLGRALQGRAHDQVTPTLHALRDPVIRELLVIRLTADRPQAFARTCWSVVIARLDAELPAWRLQTLAEHVPQCFVADLLRRTQALSNPVDAVAVLCALAPRAASPTSAIRSALSQVNNLRSQMRDEPFATLAAAQRASLCMIGAALGTFSTHTQGRLRQSAVRQAKLIRCGYEREAALAALCVGGDT